jgi:tripartite-type tricarboxylate transporter receptor subunit TctC
MRYAILSKALVSMALFLAGSAATAAWAQPFPNRPIRFIVPYSAGTGGDVIARMIAPAYSDRLKQPILIENRTGGGATVGANYLKQATPDGYTMGIIASANTVAPWMTKNMPFDLRTDFMPMTLLFRAPLVMLSPADPFPPKSVAEFIAYAKANPGKIFYGSAGLGTSNHFGGELMNQMAGLNMTHVPFRGSPEAYVSMMNGQIQMYFDSYAGSKALVESGKLRLLGIASRERDPIAPGAPTVAESLPGFELLAWIGCATPLGTPKEAYDRLYSDLMAVMNTPDIRKRIAATGVNPGGIPNDEFAKLIVSDLEKWGRVAKAAGIKPE